jgi:DNA-binding transcriptional ArsR family regulator
MGNPAINLDAKARLDALEAVCAAIAHPARRQILLTVHMRGSMTAGDIATTRHLHVLVDAGLLTQERQGRNRVYAVNHARLEILKDWLGWFDRSPLG